MLPLYRGMLLQREPAPTIDLALRVSSLAVFKVDFRAETLRAPSNARLTRSTSRRWSSAASRTAPALPAFTKAPCR
jgi:hypothetical protein